MKEKKRLTMRARACHVLAALSAVLLVADNSSAWACVVCFGILACVATAFAMFFVRLFKLSRASAGRDIRVSRSARLEGSY